MPAEQSVAIVLVEDDPGHARLIERNVRRAHITNAIVTLRACLKRSCSSSKTSHHQLDHGNPHPRLGRLRQGFEVFTQPPRAIEPAEGAFDDPAPLHDVKPSGVPRAFHDDEGPLPHRRDPRDELARVAPVRPDELQSRKAGDECPQHRFGPIAGLDAS